MNLRLYGQVVSIETRKRMSYRGDFWIDAVASFCVEVLVAFFLWRAIFAESGEARIGGLDLEGMILYYVLALLFGRLIRGSERQMSVARDIYEGTLTRYLVWPAHYFAFKYAERLGSMLPALVQLVLFGGLTLLAFDLRSLGPVSPGSAARTAVAIAVGSVLAFLLAVLLESVAFWADNVWSLNVMLRFVSSLLGGQLLPLNLFPGWAQSLLELLPFQFLFYFPVMTLVGKIGPIQWLTGIGVGAAWCLVLGLAVRLVWSRGARVYTGVGI